MEFRCSNCGTPATAEDDVCPACGHGALEQAVVRMRWKCVDCGELNQDADTTCWSCGSRDFEEADPADFETDDLEQKYTEWVCTECGAEHVRNSPPCKSCGNLHFEQREVRAADVDPEEFVELPEAGGFDWWVVLAAVAGLVVVLFLALQRGIL